jgi:hypothetical protein
MSKKTIYALVAGFITALGVTGLFTVSNKVSSANRPDTRLYSNLDKGNTSGWYTNKARRGLAKRKRIYRLMS